MIWYPYEQMKTMKAPYKIIKAKGVHLYTEDQELIDSVSSWWCMIHGYQHPELTPPFRSRPPISAMSCWADSPTIRSKSCRLSWKNFCRAI